MTGINLLPWREQLRAERQRQFIINFVAVLMLAVGAVFLLERYLHGAITQQNTRNGFLTQQLSTLDQRVIEVAELQARRQQLTERMTVIYQLQDKRAVAARILDQLVRTLPQGVYFTDLKLVDQLLSIEGIAESNKSISSLMRKQQESEWLIKPSLVEVKTIGSDKSEQLNRFKLTVQQRVMSDRAE